MERPQIGQFEISHAFQSALDHMETILKKKGRGSFISSHEVLGVLVDKRSETITAIQSKAGLAQIRHELLDEAVTALFGVACIDSGTWVFFQ